MNTKSHVWGAHIENLKCGGCERTVEKILTNIEGVSTVKVDAERGYVEMEFVGSSQVIDRAIKFLHKAGYAPAGESTFRDKAVSYLSCMKGKLSDKSQSR